MSHGDRYGDRLRLVVTLAGIIAAFAAVAVAAPLAVAAAPQLIWQLPEAGPGTGPAAGELANPKGIAADPLTGSVFVVDYGNARIDEFTVWGEFVKAFGWNVNASAPAAELQVCTAVTGCKKGTVGGGAGQFNEPSGLAIDAAGTIYVSEPVNHRVQAFDRDGNFLFMVGGGVNKSQPGQTKCPIASGDECQAGTAGTGPGEFSNPTFGDYVAVGPGGLLYVGDVGRIQKFAADGTFAGEVTGAIGANAVEALEIDGSGNSYVILQNQANVLKLGPAGESLLSFPVAHPLHALALGSQGEVYAVNDPKPGAFGAVVSEPRVVEFSASGSQILPTAEEEKAEEAEPPAEPFPFAEAAPPTFGPVFASEGELNGLATNHACGVATDSIYTSYSGGIFDNSPFKALLRAFGSLPNPAVCAPPEVPPSISAQFASSVGSDSATLKAAINPHFWPTTSYFVEYGLGKCSEGGCPEKQPMPPTVLNSVANSPVTTSPVPLSGLTSETTYHFRFVAVTRFEGGSGQIVEVKGVGGKPGADGSEGTFTTREPTLPQRADCPNQLFRVGSSAHLTNCRAYEMVSPVNKEGADITAVNTLVTEQPARLDQSAASGDALTYSAYRAFASPVAAPFSSQFLSSRGADAWSTVSISPGRGEALESVVETGDNEFQAFSADLCQAWFRMMFVAEPQLDPNELNGFPSEFRRENCSPQSGEYQALTTVEPPHLTAAQRQHFNPNLQGVSADGRCAVFRAPDTLTPDAPLLPLVEAENILYENCAGVLRLVAILPDGTPLHSSSVAGIGNQAEALSQNVQRSNTDYRAVSQDGTSIYWTSPGEKLGKLYLRIHADQPQSPVVGGKCTDPAMACTLPVSELVPGGGARFWTASADGTRAIFSSGEFLYEYSAQDPANPHATVIASGIDGQSGMGLLGASEDASRIYFASKSAVATGAIAGRPNLYFLDLTESSSPRFIGILDPSDLDRGGLVESTAISPRPNYRSSRVSRDGLHAAFMSSAPLTGFNNTDQVNGAADREVFVYDASADGGSGRLVCVSCDPSGSRPVGREISNNEPSSHTSPVWAAARIPTWPSSLYPSNALVTEGPGVRLFFDSFVPLVGNDTNEKADVYEWESADSRAACEQAGAERYVPSMAGCLSLISSGQSNQDSEFIDASPTGRDVFFATGQSLLPQDPGLIDIYDAREEGGFPQAQTPSRCEGESCQQPGAAPGVPNPASGVRGEGNPKQPKRCPKGQRKVKKKGGRTVCVKKKHHNKKHHKKKHHKKKHGAKSKGKRVGTDQRKGGN